MNNFRNRLARKIANFAMNYIATKEYCDAMTDVINRGMVSARSDWPKINGQNL